MKVILLRDVARLGKRNSIVEVPDGYALNRLIPQGLAIAATKGNTERITAMNREQATHDAKADDILTAALRELATTPLAITSTANDHDHLFKAVTMGEIASALKARGISIKETSLKTATPIKSLGTHDVQVKEGGVTGTFQVVVSK
jgi:large subunit ribosomal protein L9